MEQHIKAIGILLIMLSLLHIGFPKYFKWQIGLSALSPINRQIMYVHTFFIALTVFLMGMLCITSSHDLATTALGKRISLALGLFWGMRLFAQFFFYSRSLWLGKRFETIIHIIFSAMWTYISSIFMLIYCV